MSKNRTQQLIDREFLYSLPMYAETLRKMHASIASAQFLTLPRIAVGEYYDRMDKFIEETSGQVESARGTKKGNSVPILTDQRIILLEETKVFYTEAGKYVFLDASCIDKMLSFYYQNVTGESDILQDKFETMGKYWSAVAYQFDVHAKSAQRDYSPFVSEGARQERFMQNEKSILNVLNELRNKPKSKALALAEYRKAILSGSHW